MGPWRRSLDNKTVSKNLGSGFSKTSITDHFGDDVQTRSGENQRALPTTIQTTIQEYLQPPMAALQWRASQEGPYISCGLRPRLVARPRPGLRSDIRHSDNGPMSEVSKPEHQTSDIQTLSTASCLRRPISDITISQCLNV